YVYRGDRLPQLDGAYLYGDYETGKIWSLRYDGKSIESHQEIADTTIAIICFGQDASGEVYMVDYAGGIYRLAPTPPSDRRGVPRRLSQTGLFNSVAEQTPAEGVQTFSVLIEPWFDGTTAERFIGIPEGQFTTDRFGWEPPEGTVAARTVTAKVGGEDEELL